MTDRLGRLEIEMSANLSRLQADFDRMEKRVDRAFGRISKSVRQVDRAFLALRTSIAAVAVTKFAASVIQAGRSMQGIEQAMKAASGSAQLAGENLDFVRTVSNQLGRDLEVSARGFSQLAASAKGTAITNKDLRQTFLGISEASAVLQLNSEQTKRSITALSQIISKGKVSSEELRQQLGEQLPGAMQIAARGLGVTTAELSKMLEKGQIASEQFIPAFAQELRKTFAEDVPAATQSAEAAFGRLSTAFFDFKVDLAKSGLLDTTVQLSKGITTALKNFDLVKLATFDLIASFDEAFVEIKFGTNVTVEAFKALWQGGINTVKQALGGLVGIAVSVATGLGKIGIVSDTTISSLQALQKRLTDVPPAADTLKAAIEKLRAERDKELENIENARQLYEADVLAKSRVNEVTLDLANSEGNLKGAIGGTTKSLKDQVKELKKLHAAQERINAILQEQDELVEDQRRFSEEMRRERQAVVDQLQEEKDALGKTNTEREIAIRLRQANTTAISAEGKKIVELVTAIEKEKKILEAIEKQKEQAVKLFDKMVEGIQDAFTRFYASLLKDTKGFLDNLKDLIIRTLAEIAAKKTVGKILEIIGVSVGGSAGAGGGVGGAIKNIAIGKIGGKILGKLGETAIGKTIKGVGSKIVGAIGAKIGLGGSAAATTGIVGAGVAPTGFAGIAGAAGTQAGAAAAAGAAGAGAGAGLGATLAAAAPWAAAAIAGFVALKAIFGGGRSKAEVFADEMKQVTQDLQAGTTKLIQINKGNERGQFDILGGNNNTVFAKDDGRLKKIADAAGLKTFGDKNGFLRIEGLEGGAAELGRIVREALQKGISEGFSLELVKGKVNELSATFDNAAKDWTSILQRGAEEIGGSFEVVSQQSGELAVKLTGDIQRWTEFLAREGGLSADQARIALDKLFDSGQVGFDLLRQLIEGTKGGLDEATGAAFGLADAIRSIPPPPPVSGPPPAQQQTTSLGNFAAGGSRVVPGVGNRDLPFTIGLTPGEVLTVTDKGSRAEVAVLVGEVRALRHDIRRLQLQQGGLRGR